MPQRPPRLDATLLDRIMLRPGWTRTALVRRITAGGLALVAVVLFVKDASPTDRVGVVVAARDLTPGTPLTDADVVVADFEPASVPSGALTDIADATAHTVAGPIRAGEPLTDVRLLGSRLAAAALDSTDARIVPIRLTDVGVTDLLREGDTVDVLTVGGPDDQAARILASRSIVVLVSPKDARDRGSDRVVLVAMPPDDATTVAAASLVSSLTVTFH
ncbi:SAF domain-containing protein [Rhodococcoides kyotonense]|uniref:Flp pilus assembly protein CpaB n=1 Tax=Rhodococcoides kyotonense TaxID=398843 RepID=A0A239ELH2_9NOCA|nr:SAF domain-containing protein [Rhodococcus kyotonensis]SNS45477.1 Flp pilus assembly protein CpaB [Rhodococcus kyotonensis]